MKRELPHHDGGRRSGHHMLIGCGHIRAGVNGWAQLLVWRNIGPDPSGASDCMIGQIACWARVAGVEFGGFEVSVCGVSTAFAEVVYRMQGESRCGEDNSEPRWRLFE